jgi:hypothetical protein
MPTTSPSDRSPQFPPSFAVREQLEGGGLKVAAGEALEQAIRTTGFSINAKRFASRAAACTRT